MFQIKTTFYFNWFSLVSVLITRGHLIMKDEGVSAAENSYFYKTSSCLRSRSQEGFISVFFGPCTGSLKKNNVSLAAEQRGGGAGGGAKSYF